MTTSNFRDGWTWNHIQVSYAMIHGEFYHSCASFFSVSGLAKLEGEIADIDEGEDEAQPTKYQLTGIVVHSGQASGGHYYSYILHKYDHFTVYLFYKMINISLIF